MTEESDALRESKEPFNQFMGGILDAYHEKGLVDGESLSAHAATLLAAFPRPMLAEGASVEEAARALVQRAEDMPAEEPSDAMQWLIDALVLWPDCAESYMWVANIIEGRDNAAILMLPFYTLAIEALRRRLGPGGAVDDDGRPREVPEVPLLVKALVALGETFATTGYSGDGVPLYVEALRYDPEDRQGARPRLALALAIRSDPEGAAAALSKATPTPLVLYARAIAAYCRGDAAAPSRQALLDARRANPYVTAIITGKRKMVGMLTGDQAFDNAQYIYLAIAPALKVVPGLVAWIRRETTVGGAPAHGGSKKKKR
ncbi:MAG: hypothetical protein ACKVT1_08175 [Dehalococcoidia bacterium]